MVARDYGNINVDTVFDVLDNEALAKMESIVDAMKEHDDSFGAAELNSYLSDSDVKAMEDTWVALRAMQLFGVAAIQAADKSTLDKEGIELYRGFSDDISEVGMTLLTMIVLHRETKAKMQ